jgi:hypothetical protein
VAIFERGLWQRTRSGRVRSDAFSTRCKISSNRLNADMDVSAGPQRGRSRSVAVRVTPLTRRSRARVRSGVFFDEIQTLVEPTERSAKDGRAG